MEFSSARRTKSAIAVAAFVLPALLVLHIYSDKKTNSEPDKYEKIYNKNGDQLSQTISTSSNETYVTGEITNIVPGIEKESFRSELDDGLSRTGLNHLVSLFEDKYLDTIGYDSLELLYETIYAICSDPTGEHEGVLKSDEDTTHCRDLNHLMLERLYESSDGHEKGLLLSVITSSQPLESQVAFVLDQAQSISDLEKYHVIGVLTEAISLSTSPNQLALAIDYLSTSSEKELTNISQQLLFLAATSSTRYDINSDTRMALEKLVERIPWPDEIVVYDSSDVPPELLNISDDDLEKWIEENPAEWAIHNSLVRVEAEARPSYNMIERIGLQRSFEGKSTDVKSVINYLVNDSSDSVFFYSVEQLIEMEQSSNRRINPSIQEILSSQQMVARMENLSSDNKTDAGIRSRANSLLELLVVSR